MRSVMPKGVEHFEQAGVWDPQAVVMRSVMPKGVEHAQDRD